MQQSKEMVNHPNHYGGVDNPYEAIKVIEAWDLDFHLGNAVKYISRAGKKQQDKELEDLLKAKWYLDRKIQNLKSGGGVVSEEIISYICKYFEVSSREAEDYVELLSEDEVRSIIKKYGVKDSQIDKMYKDAAK